MISSFFFFLLGTFFSVCVLFSGGWGDGGVGVEDHPDFPVLDSYRIIKLRRNPGNN